MKKRNGFVSNSSSCSFIVSTKEFPTAWDLADYMIETRYQYKKNYYNENICYTRNNPPKEQLSEAQKTLIAEDEKLLQQNEETYKMLKENLSKIPQKNHNLAFRSVNFDTFVTQIEVEGQKYFYVSTCNNVQWEIPRVIPNGKGPINQDYFNEGDLYDGLWNKDYIEKQTFIRIDDNEEVFVKDRFKELDQKE